MPCQNGPSCQTGPRRGKVRPSRARSQPPISSWPPMIDDSRERSEPEGLELRRVEAALRESEARYQTISELTSTYAYLTHLESDGSLTLEWVTGDFVQITGYTLEEIKQLGGPIRLIHPSDRPVAVQRTERLLAGQAEHLRVPHHHQDGRNAVAARLRTPHPRRGSQPDRSHLRHRPGHHRPETGRAGAAPERGAVPSRLRGRPPRHGHVHAPTARSARRTTPWDRCSATPPTNSPAQTVRDIAHPDDAAACMALLARAAAGQRLARCP